MSDAWQRHVLAQIRPHVARLADDITEKLVDFLMWRFELELDRMSEAFEVALSAFESTGEEPTHADPDPRDVDPVPEVRRSPGRVLHQDRQRASAGRVPERAAQAPDPRRDHGQRDARPIAPAPADRPRNAAGKRVGVCTRCGFVGGNSRGCGKPTGHATQIANTLPDLKITAVDNASAKIAAVRDRIPRPTTDAVEARRARIAELAKKRPAAPAPDLDDGNPNAREHWTDAEFAEERQRSEGKKRKGDNPVVSSSYEVTHDGADSRLASVRELKDEDELDFGAAG